MSTEYSGCLLDSIFAKKGETTIFTNLEVRFELVVQLHEPLCSNKDIFPAHFLHNVVLNLIEMHRKRCEFA